MKPATIRTQTSSGGIIYRLREGAIEIALVAVKGGRVWCLPKGLVDKGENQEETAVREVSEETGLTGRLRGKIGQVSYWYFVKEENVKYRKTVHYYLLEYVSGSTDGHDREVDASSWFPLAEAEARLSYKGDREIFLKAREMLAAGATGSR